MIDTEQFSACFVRWVEDLSLLSDGEIINIDGKCLRGSKASNQSAIYMVSAWASQNQLVLGQQKVDEKSNEITAIPKLLAQLDIAGCVVTLDAMGCQTEIAKDICERQADYVLSLKGNQGHLHDDVKTLLRQAQHKFLRLKVLLQKLPMKVTMESMGVMKYAVFAPVLILNGSPNVIPSGGA